MPRIEIEIDRNALLGDFADDPDADRMVLAYLGELDAAVSDAFPGADLVVDEGQRDAGTVVRCVGGDDDTEALVRDIAERVYNRGRWPRPTAAE